MKNKINILKSQQRKKFRIIRKELSKKNINCFNEKIINKFFDNFKPNNFEIIASFFSINTEISTKLLNKYLINKNSKLVFPVVKNNINILSFRLFKIDQNLQIGNFDIPEPNEKNAELIPNLLFVPCLAFDSYGYRLGYGGGYYDRTFEFFNNIKHKFISIGYAYENQKVDKVVRDSNDIKLNYVLTEKQLYTFL